MKGLQRAAPVLLVLLAACHGRLPLAGPATRTDLPPLSAEKLVAQVLQHNAPPSAYYSAKAQVEVRMADGSRSVKAHVRCVRDSAIWLSVVPALGIEAARVLLTPDSFMFLDRLHDTYWKGDTAAARVKFGVQLRLDLFQDALMGMPVGLSGEEKYRSDREDGKYVITSKERRKFIRAAEDLAPGDTLPHDRDLGARRMERTLRKAERRDALVYKYWIDPDSMRVVRVFVADLARDQQADVQFTAFTRVEGRAYPAQVMLSLSAPGRRISGSLVLDRIALHGPLQLPFTIPGKFTPME